MRLIGMLASFLGLSILILNGEQLHCKEICTEISDYTSEFLAAPKSLKDMENKKRELMKKIEEMGGVVSKDTAITGIEQLKYVRKYSIFCF